MYMSLMELVKAEVQVPRLMRKPPIITTGRWPKRLLSMVATGATVGEEGHYSDGAFPPKIVPLCLSDCASDDLITRCSNWSRKSDYTRLTECQESWFVQINFCKLNISKVEMTDLVKLEKKTKKEP